MQRYAKICKDMQSLQRQNESSQSRRGLALLMRLISLSLTRCSSHSRHFDFTTCTWDLFYSHGPWGLCSPWCHLAFGLAVCVRVWVGRVQGWNPWRYCLLSFRGLCILRLIYYSGDFLSVSLRLAFLVDLPWSMNGTADFFRGLFRIFDHSSFFPFPSLASISLPSMLTDFVWLCLLVW